MSNGNNYGYSLNLPDTSNADSDSYGGGHSDYSWLQNAALEPTLEGYEDQFGETFGDIFGED